MKILVFDNYDSFTYNLVHLVEKIVHQKVDVYRNDRISLDDINEYDKVILSPGPGLPEEAGLLIPLIKRYAASKSILGVCLGHQAIAEAFGGKLINLSTVYHGVASSVSLYPDREPELFAGLPDTIEAGRYHSWVVKEEDFPDQLTITARDDHQQIMALRHKEYDVKGVQFHPESILTPEGEKILRNWLSA